MILSRSSPINVNLKGLILETHNLPFSHSKATNARELVLPIPGSAADKETNTINQVTKINFKIVWGISFIASHF